MASPTNSPVVVAAESKTKRQTIRFTTTQLDRIEAHLQEAQEKLANGTTERQHAAAAKSLAKAVALIQKPRSAASLSKTPAKTNPYNEFVKEAMKDVLSDPANKDKTNSERMSICAAKWREHKATMQTPTSD